MRNTEAWQKLDELVMVVYQVSQAFPAVERYGLTSQLRRAAVSAAANVAEGSGRKTVGDYLHFLYIARGSLREVEYYLHLAGRLGYLDKAGGTKADGARNQAGRTLHGLIESWEQKRNSSGDLAPIP